MKRAALISFALSLAAAPALAETVQHACVSGDATRAVEIVSPGRGDLACEVIYRKPSEGVAEQVLWSANHDVGFCTEKAQAFVARLEGWGWDCAQVQTEISPDQPAAASEATDEATAEDQGADGAGR